MVSAKNLSAFQSVDQRLSDTIQRITLYNVNAKSTIRTMLVKKQEIKTKTHALKIALVHRKTRWFG